MPKETSEAQLLNLLKQVLPKTVADPSLVEKIYSACEKEIGAKTRVAAFEKFCKTIALPDLEKKSVSGVKQQLEANFGQGTVNVVPHSSGKAASVEVISKEGTYEGTIKVGAVPEVAGSEDEEKPKFQPLPVCMPGDPEMVWVLARHENLTAEEALMKLDKVQEDFWESKSGQKHLRERVERTFPEFIAKVPSKMLTEFGLKRHYKDPEPVKELKLLKARKQDRA